MVQVNFALEIEVFYVLFESDLFIFSSTSLKQHKEYFHFMCKIQLDLPVEDTIGMGHEGYHGVAWQDCLLSWDLDDLPSRALLCHYRLSKQFCYMFLLLPLLSHCSCFNFTLRYLQLCLASSNDEGRRSILHTLIL